MAGPNTIQRVPRGLTGLLDLKAAGGALPSELAPFVQGVTDLTQFYLADSRRFQATGFAAPAPGYLTSGNPVPAGEIWLPINFTMTITTGAAGVFSMYLGYSSAQSSGTFRALTDRLTTAASLTYTWGKQFVPGELVMPPGFEFGAYVQSAAGAFTSGTIAVDYYRVLI